MCYGDIDYGYDRYYRQWMEQTEQRYQEDQRQEDEEVENEFENYQADLQICFLNGLS